jgi:hypothetical protein
VVSFDEFEERRRCWVRGCREERDEGPFCCEHADMVPEDLMERIRWAYDDGNTMDWIAAIRAAVAYIRET